MRSFRAGFSCIAVSLAVSICFSLNLRAQQAVESIPSAKGDAPRIREDINDRDLASVPRSHHPLASSRNDRGRVDAALPMKRMMLLLKPSSEQEAALRKLIDAQHDRGSAQYQRWLTPEQFAAQFGPNREDLHKITAWLQQSGFEVSSLARGGQWIEFSGSAAQVEKAFHTEMHHYLVDGETRIANATDISLPKALTPAVYGILSLHNFPKKPFHGKLIHLQRDPATGEFKRTVSIAPPASDNSRASVNPEFTLNNGGETFHFIAPEDWSRIYNTAPLIKEGVNGSGVSIAVVGADSRVQLSDIRTFRHIFELPDNDPELIINGIDPGIIPFSAAEEEADLDIEWSGAIAPHAHIKFVTSASTASTNGFDLSLAHIVDNRLAPIMSVSIGGCELFFGPEGNAFLNSIYRQAVAEGMTVVSAAGDTGAAGCDPQVSEDPAHFGPAVNASASTPYNIAIGGTAFAENGLDANYWSANNRKNLSSAIGYIPETVWNETCDPNIDSQQCFNSGLFFLDAGSGGPSSCVRSTIFDDGSFSCDAGYPKPAWQAGFGVPRDGVRDLPDVSFAAAAQHDGYLVCVEGSCQTTTNNGQTILQNASIVGGTSAGAPTFSGALALLEQKHGAYQGLLNFKLYQLAASENIAGCNSSHKLDPTFKSSCIFYDVTIGNNDVPGLPGAHAAAGFDLATGLGSVNIANLVDQWTSVAKLPSATQLAVREARAIQHGQPLPMHVDVSSRRGSGSPSGDFSLVTDKFGSVLGGTLTDGTFSGSVNALPGGDYRVFAHYAGDAMFEPSESHSVRVSVSPEPSRISVTPWQINLFDFPSVVDSPVPYGQPVGVQVDVAGASGVGSPSGSIVIRVDGVKNLGPYPLNALGNAFVWLDHLDMKDLLPGAHKFVVSYSGDNSFNPVTSPAANVTIQKDQVIEIFVGALQKNPDPNVPTVLTAGQPIDLEVELSGLEEPLLGAQLPTGTAVIYECVSMSGARRCNGWKALTGAIALRTTGLLGPGVVQAHFRTTFTAGDHLLAASYSGDAHYGSIAVDDFVGAVANPISVAPAVAATISVKSSASTINLGQSVNYLVSLAPTKSGAPVPTGSITLVDVNGDSIAGPLALQQGHSSFTVPWYQAGQDLVVALYSGDNKYAQLYSSISTVTVNPGHSTATLSVAGSAKPGSTTDLTVVVGGGPSNPHIGTPGQELGQIEYLDSIDGAPAQLLGGAPQTLTVGNQNTSVNIFPVTLQSGHHIITARFLGTADWTPAQSNSITLAIGKSNNSAVAGGKGE